MPISPRPQRPRRIPLATDCRCGHTYNWHIPADVCRVPNCTCKAMAPRDPK